MPGSRGVGLYFDDTKIYVVELHKEFGETQIVRSTESDVPAAVSGALPLTPAAAFARTARQTLEKAKISLQNIFIAIPEKEVMTRYFEIPLVPKKEWANVIRFEAQKYVPFDVHELYYDYDVFVDRVHRKIGVAFVAARKKEIDDMVEALRAEGIAVAAIETASIALVRALQLQEGKEVRALIHRNRDGASTVVLFKHRSVLMSRTTPARVARLGDIKGTAEESFLADARLAFNYFSKNFKNEVIKAIFVSADASESADWVALIGREFGLPTQPASAVSALGRGRTLSPGMNIAAGLALREVRNEGGKKVTLLPKEKTGPSAGAANTPLAPGEEEALLRKWAQRELIAAGLLLATTYLFFSSRVAAEKKSLAVSRLLPYKSVTANTGMEFAQLSAKFAELETREAFLKQLINNRSDVTSKLDEIAKIIPDELRITALDYSNQEELGGESRVTLRLDGLIQMAAGGSELVLTNHFVNTLKANERFRGGLADVKLTQVKKAIGSTPGYFSVDCTAIEKRTS